MKKLFNISTFIALVLLLSSCVSESILPTPPIVEEGEYKTLLLNITKSAPETPDTRNISRPVCCGELVEFNSGDLYLINAMTSQVVRHFRIIRAGAADHNFATGGFINRDLLNFNNPAGTALLEISNVPGHVTGVFIIGNTPYNDTQGNIVPIVNRQICITTQHSALTPSWETSQLPGVNLYGISALSAPVSGVATATLLLAPTVARIEIGSIVGTGSIADFTVEGIFIDNHYRRAYARGFILNHSNLTGDSPNRKERGTNSALFRPGQPYFSFIDGSTNSGALFDLNTGRSTYAWQDRPWQGRRPGVHGAPGTASLTVTPGGTSTITTCTAIGCTNVHTDIPNVWAYQVFAHSDILGLPFPHADTRLPRVIIRLSNIRLIDSPTPLPGYRYITVREFYDHTGTAVERIQAGYVYHIAAVMFDDRDLRPVPNYIPAEPAAHSQVTTFVNVMYDFQQQPLTAFVTSGATPTAWQWQVSTDNETWINITGATTPEWTLPAWFIHNPATYGLPATMFNGVNELFFRNTMTVGAARFTQLDTQTLAIRFIRTTETGVANTPGHSDFITGFGMTGTTRWADINRAGGTIRVALLNLGAADTDGGLGYLFQWGRRADGHQVIDWTKNASGMTVPGPNASGNQQRGSVSGMGITPGPAGSGQPTVYPWTDSFIYVLPDGSLGWDWGTNAADNADLWGDGSFNWWSPRPSTYTWGTRAQSNNPCYALLGAGWRLPNRWELWDMHWGDGTSDAPWWDPSHPQWDDMSQSNTNWYWRPMRANAAGGSIITNLAGGSGHTGVQVFLPSAGVRGGGDAGAVNYVGWYGIYWSSTQSDVFFAMILYFSADLVHAGTSNASRVHGLSVRCVAE